MLAMIAKMSAITLMFVLLTYFLWSKCRNKEMTWTRRIIIGVIYGIAAILSTHFGIDYGHMMLNVRDLGPMCAGLFFDPVSGIIAGLIGGIERYYAGAYLGIGSFTKVACSVSTCFAGFFAAFLNRCVFNGKKPSLPYAFFLGAVIEVFHMYVVFISHRDNMEMAFLVVKTVAVPMILFSAIGLGISAEVIHIKSGEHGLFMFKTSSEDVPVSHKFQAALFVVTMFVFATSFFFNYNLQTQTAIQDAKADLAASATTIQREYSQFRQHKLDVSKLIAHVGNSGTYVIFDKEGKIVAGEHAYMTDDKELYKIYRDHIGQVYYTAEYDGKKWLCRNIGFYDGFGAIAMMPNDEVFQYRDLQAYETFLADILVFTVIYMLISLLVQLIVVDNLELVNKSLAKITEGDFDEKVSVYNSSEFTSLSNDINAMVYSLKGLIAAAEKRMEQELLLAHTIQESSLPTNFDYHRNDFEIYATMDPAKEVGGDFYDFFFVDHDKIALVIADVSGKGIPAALFMMHSKTAIRSLAETGAEITELFEKVNDELCEGNQAEMFVTVWMAIINLSTGVACCVNAGHEYPAIMRKGGNYELYKDAHRIPLGCMEGMKYVSYDIKLEPGDCIYVYTDGIPEAIDPETRQYGTERMIRVLNEVKDSSMKDMLLAVKKNVDEFAGTAEQFDDQTMIGFRFNGPEE